MTVEVHRLDHSDGKDAWSVMVVVEHWWDERHKLLRNNLWATQLSGSRLRVAEWFDRQARVFDRSQGGAVNRDMHGDEGQDTEEL